MSGNEQDQLYINLIILAVVVAFAAYRWFSYLSGLKVLELLLQEYYEEEGNTILSISKLKMADKLKYGVAVSPFVSLYTSTFSYFSLKPECYYRLVETTDKTGKEFLRYVKLSFSGKNGLSVKEFDLYEF
jgi:hypothetical protein